MNYFQDFDTKAVKAKYKIRKRKQAKALNTISVVYFLPETLLFTEKFSRTTTIPPGTFGGRALWADSVPPRMNTIAPRDQCKPIRIGENLVVSYHV